MCDLDRSPDHALVLDRCQGRSLAGGFAYDDRRHPGRDLPFAKFCEGFTVDRAGFIEWGGEIGYITRQPGAGIFHGMSRRVFHLAVCSSLLRIFRQKPLSREAIRTAMAAVAERNCEIWASAASMPESEF